MESQKILVCLLLFFCLAFNYSNAAQTRSNYYAHEVAQDGHGVIAPWHTGQNGPLDTRLRIAVEVMKR